MKPSSELQRTEAFSDGVFAIAITLLALELKTPMAGEEPLRSGLLAALAHQWPSYLSFVTSFITILVMWINHHRMFDLIHKRDNTLIIFNGLLLMGITVTPFVTQLVAEYILLPDANVAATVYCLSFVWNSWMYNLMWKRASEHSRLLAADRDPVVVAHITTSYRTGLIIYSVTTFVALIAPFLSLVICFALAAYFFLPPRQRA